MNPIQAILSAGFVLLFGISAACAADKQPLVEAGEFVKIYDPSVGVGKWYVSRAGWDRGGLYLAPLIWSDGNSL